MTCLSVDTPYYPRANRDNPLKLATTASFHFTSHSHRYRPWKGTCLLSGTRLFEQHK